MFKVRPAEDVGWSSATFEGLGGTSLVFYSAASSGKTEAENPTTATAEWLIRSLMFSIIPAREYFLCR